MAYGLIFLAEEKKVSRTMMLEGAPLPRVGDCVNFTSIEGLRQSGRVHRVTFSYEQSSPSNPVFIALHLEHVSATEAYLGDSADSDLL